LLIVKVVVDVDWGKEVLYSRERYAKTAWVRESCA
jgi:hypothetical protein